MTESPMDPLVSPDTFRPLDPADANATGTPTSPARGEFRNLLQSPVSRASPESERATDTRQPDADTRQPDADTRQPDADGRDVETPTRDAESQSTMAESSGSTANTNGQNNAENTPPRPSEPSKKDDSDTDDPTSESALIPIVSVQNFVPVNVPTEHEPVEATANVMTDPDADARLDHGQRPGREIKSLDARVTSSAEPATADAVAEANQPDSETTRVVAVFDHLEGTDDSKGSRGSAKRRTVRAKRTASPGRSTELSTGSSRSSPTVITPADSAARTAVTMNLAIDAINATPAGQQEKGESTGARPDAPISAVNREMATTKGLPEQLFTQNNQKANDDYALRSADRVRLVQRVARAMQSATQRGGILRLRLHPPELGSLRMEVTLEQATLSARIETETYAARNALLDTLPQLRERLAEQGIRIEQFQVDVGQRDTGQTPRHPGDGQAHSDMPRAASGENAAAKETNRDVQPARISVMTDRSLNVIV